MWPYGNKSDPFLTSTQPPCKLLFLFANNDDECVDRNELRLRQVQTVKQPVAKICLFHAANILFKSRIHPNQYSNIWAIEKLYPALSACLLRSLRSSSEVFMT